MRKINLKISEKKFSFTENFIHVESFDHKGVVIDRFVIVLIDLKPPFGFNVSKTVKIDFQNNFQRE